MILKKTKALEKKVDTFLDIISQSGLTLLQGVKAYLQDDSAQSEHYHNKLSDLESKADEIRREVEAQLYEKTLIPESRGDVLGLLENLDRIINLAKEILTDFMIELPRIPGDFHADFIQLTDYGSRTIDEIATATRAFLHQPLQIKKTLHKVYYWEKESDKQAEMLKRKIFRHNSLKDLSHKIHLRNFALNLDRVADRAEDVADRLAVYSIKRSI